MQDSGDLLRFQADVDELLNRREDKASFISLFSERIAGPEHRRSLPGMLANEGEHSFLCGMFLLQRPFADYFGPDAKVAITDEPPLVLVHTRSQFGTARFWLDPEYGCLPRKIELTLRGSDYFDERRISEIWMNGDGGRMFPAGGVVESVTVMEPIGLARSDGKPYMREVTVSHRTVSQAGPVTTRITHATVEHIDFNPVFRDEDFQPTLKFPDGFEVHVAGADHLPYVWSGGQAVTYAVSVARERWSGDFGRNRMLILWANIILMMLISIVVLWRLWARRA